LMYAPKLVSYWHGTSPLNWKRIQETQTINRGTISQNKGEAGWHAIRQAQSGQGVILEIKHPKGARNIEIGSAQEVKSLSLAGRTTAHFFPVYPKDLKLKIDTDIRNMLERRGV